MNRQTINIFKKIQKFLYIDRVGVKKGFENRGFGSFMYGNIFKNYINEQLTICAEEILNQ